MSVDLERYAELYRQFGDEDIEGLLEKAAEISRRKGRPEIVYIENPLDFRLRSQQLVQEMEQRLRLQKKLVDFFRREAPIGTTRNLADLAEPYHYSIGERLGHEVPLSTLVLPTKSRASGNRQDTLLLEESHDIARNIKTNYNRMVLYCVRAGLLRVGDVRNVAGLGEDFVMRPMTPYTAKFMRTAL